MNSNNFHQSSTTKHAIINTPQLKAEFIIHTNGPYNTVQLKEDNDYWYVAGSDGMNAVSFPDGPYRTVWSQDIADVIKDQLNKKFPVDISAQA